MTAFEWVERFNDRVALSTDEHNSLVSLFAQAINEEREACAKLADDRSEAHYEAQRQCSVEGDIPGNCQHGKASNACLSVAHDIRARGTR